MRGQEIHRLVGVRLLPAEELMLGDVIMREPLVYNGKLISDGGIEVILSLSLVGDDVVWNEGTTTSVGNPVLLLVDDVGNALRITEQENS